MEKEDPQVLKRNVSVVLDEILARHMERLLGSRFGIEGLPMNLRTLACITLLTEGMESSDSRSSAPEEAHTLESLRTQLGDLGLGGDEDLQPLLQELTQRGYALARERGFLAAKPALTMAQVMGRIFPRMNGAGFLAYLVQTIDEVSSGRKALEAAALQFDQTLKMQGVPLKRRSDSQAPKVISAAPALTDSIREKSLHRGTQAPGRRAAGAPGAQGKVRMLGASVDSLVLETRGIETVIPHSAQPFPPADLWQGHEPPEVLGTPYTEAVSAHTDEVRDGPSDAWGVPPPEPPAVTGKTSDLEAPVPPAEDLPPSLPAPEPEPPAASQERPEPLPECRTPEEGSVEEEISRFEEELAAQCPLCRTSSVQQRQTPAGRTYYQCDNRECSFVSWGRPYHLACPRCRNPFMVELPEPGEKRLLRCPRATCRYATPVPSLEAPRSRALRQGGDQGLDGVRRRVVRRRVVRKKK